MEAAYGWAPSSDARSELSSESLSELRASGRATAKPVADPPSPPTVGEAATPAEKEDFWGGSIRVCIELLSHSNGVVRHYAASNFMQLQFSGQTQPHAPNPLRYWEILGHFRSPNTSTPPSHCLTVVPVMEDVVPFSSFPGYTSDFVDFAQAPKLLPGCGDCLCPPCIAAALPQRHAKLRPVLNPPPPK